MKFQSSERLRALIKMRQLAFKYLPELWNQLCYEIQEERGRLTLKYSRISLEVNKGEMDALNPESYTLNKKRIRRETIAYCLLRAEGHDFYSIDTVGKSLILSKDRKRMFDLIKSLSEEEFYDLTHQTKQEYRKSITKDRKKKNWL